MRLATLAAFLLSACAVTTAFHGVHKRFMGQPNRCFMGHTLNMVGGKGDFMTQPACRNICIRKGTKYFGLTKGDTCLCDDFISPNGYEVGGRQCQQKCVGHPQEACGSARSTLVFHVSKYVTIPAAQYGGLRLATATRMGCVYSDSDMGMALSVLKMTSKHMTVGYCHTLCNRSRKRFFGLANGNACYCDNSLHRKQLAPFKTCEAMCSGNYMEICGSDQGMMIFGLKYT